MNKYINILSLHLVQEVVRYKDKVFYDNFPIGNLEANLRCIEFQSRLHKIRKGKQIHNHLFNYLRKKTEQNVCCTLSTSIKFNGVCKEERAIWSLHTSTKVWSLLGLIKTQERGCVVNDTACAH